MSFKYSFDFGVGAHSQATISGHAINLAADAVGRDVARQSVLDKIKAQESDDPAIIGLKLSVDELKTLHLWLSLLEDYLLNACYQAIAEEPDQDWLKNHPDLVSWRETIRDIRSHFPTDQPLPDSVGLLHDLGSVLEAVLILREVKDKVAREIFHASDAM